MHPGEASRLTSKVYLPECLEGWDSRNFAFRSVPEHPYVSPLQVTARRPVQACVRWKEDLPPGYRLREDADLRVLLGPYGSKVVAFSALGADPLEVNADAWEDHG